MCSYFVLGKTTPEVPFLSPLQNDYPSHTYDSTVFLLSYLLRYFLH